MKSKKKQVYNLWKAVFGDSDTFMDLYFSRVYKDENAMTIERDGTVVSALQMLPYTMTFCGQEISVAYISGACTSPSEQGKGLMKQLLRESFDEMRRRNIDITALIPAEKWLFNYYRSMGYTEVFEYSLVVYTRNEYITPELSLQVEPLNKIPDATLYAYFDRKLRERQTSILHTYDDFVTIYKDLKTVDGTFFVAYNDEMQPVGLAHVTPPGKTNPENVFIKEFLYNNEQAKTQMLFEITKSFEVEKAVYRQPFSNHLVAYPYGMASVINKEKLIGLWLQAHPESSVTAEEMEAMDIRSLTAHLFDYANKTAYMSLMLD
ncbi:GNAT superfamily N-acetyltransferase [Parabacteroides sp. PF5-5]|uniref:GNAT family N-acetyltransferase n=1 Tax=unclassified Parabacteroides TaxID=2649774 RepID=UPI00247681C3|nr:MULTISPECIES: GNAT family N-acetyltransferase [unclassified Parabacteroides]MDH6305147.1 GNAT superfamily N-acetyltransferase [Parabacteroides sp. PH5-39]MDH6316497.1 GNAT superfamily N-acetyltransferase [Parabacteroides sp. PF5-13]MDH6320007.1 GNAT superfamily N-acetyltransferase [Parabacteroides sp. PH5-13]MDH6323760.1 GNAT superfamily N-acetyltransferase [Parabacteroides sp. PH5-8]MDH6327684.1 GNAT superfamily N-acetyltransferase [Parabacteroides sp. PH5-41]